MCATAEEEKALIADVHIMKTISKAKIPKMRGLSSVKSILVYIEHLGSMQSTALPHTRISSLFHSLSLDIPYNQMALSVNSHLVCSVSIAAVFL